MNLAKIMQETLPHPTFTDSGVFANPVDANLSDEGLAPTQRISQVMQQMKQMTEANAEHLDSWSI